MTHSMATSLPTHNGNGCAAENGSTVQQPQSRMKRTQSYFSEEITLAWGDAVLILMCFITGLLDSAAFNVWSCFVSMQTGNTVYVGLGISGQPASQPLRWIKSLTAILSFMSGAFLFSRFSRQFQSPLQRLPVISSLFIQASLCLLSAGLVRSGFIPPDAGDLLPDNYIVLLPLSLLAMQAAGQIVLSKALGHHELSTVVLTSLYADLLIDANVFVPSFRKNAPRNRRVAGALMLIAGAGVGGYLTRGGSVEVALWVAGGTKVGMVLAFVGWRRGEGVVRLS
ncbi:hypothetical protein BDV98DRAFT_553201 [Pterulicium gracile]|uniref:DUF1275 domain protein n=1 Tax=Pterulicium gracile TaxID=1884261 RepID=A0A5C3QIA7_9AGAR|nr:hypothetical protein BDV98DRAFT_553201 [Pterula gracilis]